MKRKSLSAKELSASEMKSPDQKIASKQSQQSPYLKAILSSKNTPGPTQVFSIVNSSMAAALRYISHYRQNA